MGASDPPPTGGSTDQLFAVEQAASETADSPAAEQEGSKQAGLLAAESSAVEQAAESSAVVQAAESSVVVLLVDLGAIHQRSLAARRWGNWLPQMEHSGYFVQTPAVVEQTMETLV